MYKTIIFDLDGTIVDSGPGIINSVVYSLKKFGIETADKNELRKFIGPPLKSSFKEFYGFNDDKAELAVKYYREYYSERGIFECELYPGITDLIHKLHSAGKRIMLATSKPELFAGKILEHFSLVRYFDIIAGLRMDDLSSEKVDIIRKALTESGVCELSEVIMIGDRKHDIIGAHKLNLKCMAVLFGYGCMEEFLEHEADYIVSDSNEILDICMK